MKNLIILVLSFFSFQVFANSDDGLTVIAVGQAELEKEKIIILDPYHSKTVPFLRKKTTNDLVALFRNDFSFYRKRFQVVRGNAATGKPDYKQWKAKQARFVIQSSFEGVGEDLNYKVEMFDINKKEMIFKETGPIGERDLRKVGHKTADEMYRMITGKPSIFQSKILFVSDKGSKGRDVRKELYIMDFDGRNTKALTRHRGIVLSPSISPDGKKVLYSLIQSSQKKRDRNIDLYILDLETNKRRKISHRKGINSGAVFMPDGKSIALTLSHTGNAEIFIMDLATGSLKRLTRHFAPDVDPSISSDGSLMTFLSGRAGPGRPMIYTMDPSGEEKSVKRISFVGRFNATPRFSPDGREIVFSSWMDNRFDIFRIGSKGTDLARLTKDFGSNEDPTYSNDGQFIAFSSQRVLSRTKAVHNLYIMDREGEILGQVTQKFGNCTTPRWTK